MAPKKDKIRLDRLLVDRGLASSQEKARALILAGAVLVDRKPVLKPGHLIADSVSIDLKGREHPYVSRGGVKLAKALEIFKVEVGGKTALDVGASTGGFTHCLLTKGAGRVYAVDVGYGQLAWEIRQDPRVKAIERKNVRFLTREDIGEAVDLAVVDTSFISLKLVIPSVLPLLKPEGVIIALVKPQFEVGKGKVGKGGIVRNQEDQDQVLADLKEFFESLGMKVLNTTESPILGAKGNREFFIHLIKP
jgi:23S rRNA (cytidine1920-2'-O)/16S rRNA (cytidine1409-2'-O)-methyltransferase